MPKDEISISLFVYKLTNFWIF